MLYTTILEYVYIKASVSEFNVIKIQYIKFGGVPLANIKSAKKRIRVTERKTLRNKAIKSEVKTVVKKVDAAVAASDKELATELLKDAISEINRGTSKGVFHKNTASRKISRLTKAVNSIS